MNFQQPPWFSGSAGQSFERIVISSHPDCEVSGRGDAQEITDGWMNAHIKGWGPLSGSCGLLRVTLSCNLSQRKKKTLVFHMFLLPGT